MPVQIQTPRHDCLSCNLSFRCCGRSVPTLPEDWSFLVRLGSAASVPYGPCLTSGFLDSGCDGRWSSATITFSARMFGGCTLTDQSRSKEKVSVREIATLTRPHGSILAPGGRELSSEPARCLGGGLDDHLLLLTYSLLRSLSSLSHLLPIIAWLPRDHLSPKARRVQPVSRIACVIEQQQLNVFRAFDLQAKRAKSSVVLRGRRAPRVFVLVGFSVLVSCLAPC